MTALQSNSTSINSWFEKDLFEKDVFSEKERPVEYLDFDDDTLALVCGCLRVGQDLSQTFTTVEQTGKRQIELKGGISSNDREQADKIRSYFKNRIITCRLKNQFISEWMKKAEAVLETPKTLREDHISLLVKLPEFYRENTEREAVFKQHKSMPMPENKKTNVVELNSLVRFAGSVERKSKSQKHVTFYFATEDDYLVAADVERSDMGYKLWNWFSRNSQPFRLKCDSTAVSHHPGYEFYHMRLNPNYEIENA